LVVPEQVERDQAVTALSCLSDPVRRRLYEYVCEQATPVSRDQVAQATSVSRALVAYHLDKLAEAGLLEVDFQRLHGRRGPGAGRPSKRYARSAQEFSLQVPPRAYALAALLLAQAIERESTGAARAALLDVARDVGRSLGAAATKGPTRDALCQVLRDQGYEPITHKDGSIEMRNCPFHELAREHTGLACTMNHALVSGLTTAVAGSSLEADLDPAEGRCCVVVRG
jgi:predicted ArsR family transcriptional regulator